jgi:hypothetical protein
MNVKNKRVTRVNNFFDSKSFLRQLSVTSAKHVTYKMLLYTVLTAECETNAQNL